jgi:lysophospholipase L1-like esterase
VVLASPTLVHEDLSRPENVRLAAYVEAGREEAAALGWGFIDLNTAFRALVAAWRQHVALPATLLTTDGVHLNPAGNRLMASLVLRGLGAE